jgi:hypothetical protein
MKSNIRFRATGGLKVYAHYSASGNILIDYGLDPGSIGPELGIPDCQAGRLTYNLSTATFGCGVDKDTNTNDGIVHTDTTGGWGGSGAEGDPCILDNSSGTYYYYQKVVNIAPLPTGTTFNGAWVVDTTSTHAPKNNFNVSTTSPYDGTVTVRMSRPNGTCPSDNDKIGESIGVFVA